MKREINVLLLGSSGNGKSTFLNTLNKMSRYRTLDEAKSDVSKVAIPVRFKHSRVLIREGEDPNERLIQAGSSTVKPRIYIFPAKQVTLRIVDTPGIGDTDGTEKDDEHIGYILSCIIPLEQIHGILFFFKNSDDRVTTFVKYQLCQLFSCLGKAAVNNIKFVITHAGELCEPGNAVNVIESFIRTMDVPISCTDENMFCFENSAFLYLVGRNNPNTKCDERHDNTYRMTYKNTAEEYIRLLKKLYQCQTPYDVRNMTALKRARLLWPLLSPLLGVLDKKEKEIKEALESHNLNLKELMWQITGETARLVTYEVEKYKEKVRRRIFKVEEQEVDVNVQAIEWKNVTENETFQRIERLERQRDVTRYSVVYGTTQEKVTKQLLEMVTKERPVHRIRQVGSYSWETYMDTETYQAPVIREVEKNVTKVVPNVVTNIEQETYYEPVVIEEVRQVPKVVPKIVYNTEKKTQRVLKEETVLEEKEKERILKVTNPEVQKVIDEKKVKQETEDKKRKEHEQLYKKFLEEKEQVRVLTGDFARCLHENTIVAFNFAKGQYLEEELKVKKKEKNGHEAVKCLRNRLVEAQTTCAIFDTVAHNDNGGRTLLTPVQLLEKVEKLSKLDTFGPLITNALMKCEIYDKVEFQEIELEDAAEGYMFDEMVKAN